MDETELLKKFSEFAEAWNSHVFGVSTKRPVQLTIDTGEANFIHDDQDNFDLSRGICPSWLDKKDYENFHTYIGESIKNWSPKNRKWFIEDISFESKELEHIPDSASASVYFQLLFFCIASFLQHLEENRRRRYGLPLIPEKTQFFITGIFMDGGSIKVDPVNAVGNINLKLQVVKEFRNREMQTVFIIPRDNLPELLLQPEYPEKGIAVQDIIIKPVANFRDLISIFNIRKEGKIKKLPSKKWEPSVRIVLFLLGLTIIASYIITFIIISTGGR